MLYLRTQAEKHGVLDLRVLADKTAQDNPISLTGSVVSVAGLAGAVDIQQVATLGGSIGSAISFNGSMMLDEALQLTGTITADFQFSGSVNAIYSNIELSGHIGSISGFSGSLSISGGAVYYTACTIPCNIVDTITLSGEIANGY